MLGTLDVLLADEDVLEGGGGGLNAGLGGGGGFGLISAFQLIFLLGWLDIRSLVLASVLTLASLTLTALLRNSNMVHGAKEQCSQRLSSHSARGPLGRSPANVGILG